MIGRLAIVLVPLFSAISLVAMDQLTEQEKECFGWFRGEEDIRNKAYHALTPESSETLYKKNLQYAEHPDEVTAGLNNFADEFCKIVPDKKYTQHFLAATLIKMKIQMQQKTVEEPVDELTARMYVWSNKLTKDEQSTALEHNFKSNRQACEKTMQKFASLLADEKIKLGLITQEEKDQDTKNIFARKMEELDKLYISKQ